jgi:hypothetical protein
MNNIFFLINSIFNIIKFILENKISIIDVLTCKQNNSFILLNTSFLKTCYFISSLIIIYTVMGLYQWITYIQYYL